MFNYICDGQITMFDILQEKYSKEETYGDYKIDNFILFIKDIMKDPLKSFPPLKSLSVEYGVWDHVANLGKRISMFYRFDCDYNTNPDHYCGIGVNKIAELIPFDLMENKAKKIGLKLSAMNGPNDIFISTIEINKNKKNKKDIEDECEY